MFYGDGSSLGAISANKDYTVTASNTTVSVVNESTPATNSITGKTFGGGSGWNIFARSGGNNKSSYKLRSMKIWQAGGLVRDFHPCYTNTATDEVVGLYDTVNEKFYVNAGTGVFLRGDETENYLWVTGTPGEYGTPVCGGLTGYGGRPLTNGVEVTASVPVTSGETATVKYTLAGWKLTILHNNGTCTVTQNSAENAANCTFTPAEGDQATLEWQWSTQYKISVAADAGLSASASVTWADLGDTVTISATEGTAPFIAWEGDVPALDKFSSSFTITVDGPKTLRAKSAATIKYVVPGGTGDGSSWGAAYGNIQDAFTALKDNTSGSLICVKQGAFPVTAAIGGTTKAPLLIHGGYSGSGFTPGGETVVARTNSTVQTLLFSFTSSVVGLDSLTISNGYSNATTYGQGVAFLSACTSSVQNCTFVNNGNGNLTDHEVYGGALGQQQGYLSVDNCTFRQNALHDNNSSNVKPVGGALGAYAARVRIRRSSFDRNYTQHVHARTTGGGAIGLKSCPAIDIDHCTFTTNYARTSSGSGNYLPQEQYDNGPYGGTIYISSSASAVIRDCTFLGGWNASFGTGRLTWGWGGLLFFYNSTVALTRTVVYGAGESGYSSGGIYNWAWGSIDVRGGSLYMTNVLHGASYSGWLLGNNGATLEAVNCTFAGARQHGSTTRATTAYVQHDGSAAFKNCIFWNNAEGDLLIGGGAAPTFTYCITETLQPGIGNSTDDPLFGDSVYFHPKSAAGRYSGGWFDGGAWATTDTATSASIDAGAPADGFGAEPQPNLRRINLGYDGGTAVASKSVMGTDPVPSEDTLGIYAYEATAITANGATVSADVNSTGGGANPTVIVAWGPEDKGATLTGWTNTYELGTFAPWNPATHTITGITGYSTVYYRFFSTNAVGTAASDPVKSFMLASLPTIVYDTAENPVSHRYRTSARLHATLSSNGGAPTTVHVVWWPTDEPTDVTTNAANYGLAIDSGSAIAVDLTDLAPGTAYSYFIEAVNGAGATTLATKSFSTVSPAVPLGLYVGAVAAGLGDGSSAANASADFQAVINATPRAGDEIRVLSGTLTVDAELVVAGHPGLTVRGGYTGDDTRSGRSVIQRDPGSILKHRVFKVSASTITFDSVEINNGRVTSTTTFYGNAIGLYSTCNATITNCVFRNNGQGVDSLADVANYGGAVGAQNGTLRVYDSEFHNNRMWGGSNNMQPVGGAIGMYGAVDSSVEILRCAFRTNSVQSVHARAYGGGALGFRNVPAVRVTDCTFDGNFARTSSGNSLHWGGSPGPYGGAIYFSGVTRAELSDCTFRTNWLAEGKLGTCLGNGGLIYSASSTLVMNRCASYAAGLSGYSTASGNLGYGECGDISVSGGSLFMTNVLLGATHSGWALANNGGAIEAVNCTIAGNQAFSTYRSSHAYVQNSGSATFQNCILWDNPGGDYAYINGNAPMFTYSTTMALRDGYGNSTNNPQFADSVYFHPRSRAGRYDGGWFANGAWLTTDTATSPAIDAGNPAMGYGAELQPNLRRVNMGYDGGTATASKSDCGTDPVVAGDKLMVLAYAATAITDSGATLSADVASTGGGANPDVTVVWDGSDIGTNSVAAWGDNVATLGAHAPWDLVSYTITNASSLTDVYYRFVVENERGISWSDPVRHFKIARKPTIAYPAEADVVTHLYRTYARVHANLVSDGGSDATLRFVYWPAADAAAVVTNVANDGLACPAGAYTFAAENLTENTEYAYFMEAENSVGVTRLAQRTFKTRADAEKLTLVGGPANVGHGDGASFAHPSGELQMLLDALYMGGDELLLMDGTNIVADALIVNNHPGLTIRGGYTTGGASRNGESVLRRDSSLPKKHRIFDVTGSVITFDGLTVANGEVKDLETNGTFGQGVRLIGSTTLVTNCLFTGNGVNNGFVDNTSHFFCGGAIGARNGTLTVAGSVFRGNAAAAGTGGGNACVCPLGGAIGAQGATVTINRCTFDGNYTTIAHARAYGGGALGFRDCPTVDIGHSTFTTNWTNPGGLSGYYTPQKDHGPYGGTFHIRGATTVATIHDCTVVGGWNSSWNSDTPTWGWGGVLYATDSAKVALVRTVIDDAGGCGLPDGRASAMSGSLDVRGATLVMTNVLHAGARRGSCVGNDGGMLEAVNCTFADAKGEGSQPAAAYVQYGTASVTTFKNCIAWGNAGGFLYSGNQGDAPSATFSDLQGTEPDEANHVISADPKFEDAATLDYRLGNDSPCVNAGDRTGILKTEVDLGGERRISGANIDLGAYEYQQNGLLILLR